MSLTLSIVPGRFAICRLQPGPIPGWAVEGGFYSITQTGSELSIVAREQFVPASIQAEHGWRAIQVAGPLDFSLTGILAGLAAPLAEAGISIFALSTYETDYLLVQWDVLEQAVSVLRHNGHQFLESPDE